MRPVRPVRPVRSPLGRPSATPDRREAAAVRTHPPLFLAAALAGALLAGLAAPTAGAAQEIQFGGGLAEADEDLLGSPAVVRVSLSVPVLPWFGIRLSGDYGHDAFTSEGPTCTGLQLSPFPCVSEHRDEDATIRAWTLGVVFSRSLGPVELRAVPAFRRLTMESIQTGQVSGHIREADRTVYGAQLGLEALLAVGSSVPVGVYAGVYASTHPWFKTRIVPDGYVPLESTVKMVSVEAGLSVNVGRLLGSGR